MKKKGLLAILCMMLFVLALMVPAIGAAAEKPIKLVNNEKEPEGHPWTKVSLRWQEKITKRTNGRVQFQNFYAGALIGPRKSAIELAQGNADICRISAFLQGEGFTIQNTVQKFFYGAKDLKTCFEIYIEARNKFPEFAKEWDSVGKTLAYNGPGPANINTKDKPIRRLADFKGLQIRSIGPWMKPTFEKLGASAISMPPTEIYTSLQKNIIDGYVQPFDTLKSFRLAEVAKYTTIIGAYDGAADGVMMNWDSYNNLPPDIKQIIDDSLDEYEADLIETIDTFLVQALNWAKEEKGHVVINLPPDELKQYYKLLEEEALDGASKLDEQGLPGTDIFKFVRGKVEKNM